MKSQASYLKVIVVIFILLAVNANLFAQETNSRHIANGVRDSRLIGLWSKLNAQNVKNSEWEFHENGVLIARSKQDNTVNNVSALFWRVNKDTLHIAGIEYLFRIRNEVLTLTNINDDKGTDESELQDIQHLSLKRISANPMIRYKMSMPSDQAKGNWAGLGCVWNKQHFKVKNFFFDIHPKYHDNAGDMIEYSYTEGSQTDIPMDSIVFNKYELKNSSGNSNKNIFSCFSYSASGKLQNKNYGTYYNDESDLTCYISDGILMYHGVDANITYWLAKISSENLFNLVKAKRAYMIHIKSIDLFLPEGHQWITCSVCDGRGWNNREENHRTWVPNPNGSGVWDTTTEQVQETCQNCHGLGGYWPDLTPNE